MKRYPAINNGKTGAQQAQLLRDARILRRHLKRDGANCLKQYGTSGRLTQDRPILVALCGLPGAGKTYFARELTKLVPFWVLESDRIRKALVPKPKYTPGEHSRVFNVCHLLIEDYLSQGRRVLFDATNLTENFRLPLRQISRRQNARLVLVMLTAPRDIIRQRLQDREEERESGLHPGNYSDANWLIYCRLAPYEEPVEGDHLSVDTSADISRTVEDVASLATAFN